MDKMQPLPYQRSGDLPGYGSYGMVIKMREVNSGMWYAVKQQLLGEEEQDNIEAYKHLRGETQRLRNLHHRHVVRLVKTYERGKQYGMVLEPYAASDLGAQLQRFRDNGIDLGTTTGVERRDQDILAPLFLQAFGCLSNGLKYIHGEKMRHKDIKPTNILYDSKPDDSEANFLWADFGLAYDFSITGDSKTRNITVYSQRYAAPEILAINSKTNSNGAFDCSEGLLIEACQDSETAGPQEDEHGRPTDIFALGCVFFELLFCLLLQQSPTDKEAVNNTQDKGNSPSREYPPPRIFAENIPTLSQWARAWEEKVAARNIALLLRLAVKMITHDPKKRPLIDDVVREVALAGEQHFCPDCWHECKPEPQDGKEQTPPGVTFPSPKPPLEDFIERAKGGTDGRFRERPRGHSAPVRVVHLKKRLTGGLSKSPRIGGYRPGKFD